MTSATDRSRGLPVPEEGTPLVEVANAVLRHWRMIVVVPLFLAVAVGVRTFMQVRTYSASASFMPQVAEGRGAGGAAALAQQFGLSLGADRVGQSPEFYLDLLRSRTILRKAVESKYELSIGGRPSTGTLIEYWGLDGPGDSPPWRRATDILRGRIAPSAARETGVVRLTVSAEHPALAEQIAARLLQLLTEYNLEVRQNRAEEEGRFISGRITDARADLFAAERGLQEFLRQNREFRNSPELMFEHDRLQRQVLMRQEVYGSLLRSQEQARIDAVRDTPLFTVIDHPAGTGEAEARGTILRSMIAFVIGLMLAVFAALVTEFMSRGRRAEDPRYREFRGLARQVWGDLRNPRRWMRPRAMREPAGTRTIDSVP